MGKSLNDKKNNKGTALSLYSPDELKNLIEDEFTELDRYLEKACFNTDDLKGLLKTLRER